MLQQLKRDRLVQAMLTVVVLIGCAACGVWGASFAALARQNNADRPSVQAQQKTPTPTIAPTPTRLRLPTVAPSPEPILLNTFEGTGYDEFKIEVPGPGKIRLVVESEHSTTMSMYGSVKSIRPCIRSAIELKGLSVAHGTSEIEYELSEQHTFPLYYCVVIAPDGMIEMDYSVYSSIPWTVKLIGNTK